MGVLGRDDAARVISASTAPAVWAVNATNLALTIPVLIEYLGSRNLWSALPAPLLILIGLFAFAVVAAVDPRPIVVAFFVAVCGVGAAIFQVLLIGAYPPVTAEAYFLLSRPLLSLVLIAVGTASWRMGIVWMVGGFVASIAVSISVAAFTDSPLAMGIAPGLFLVIASIVHLGLAATQARLRRRLPNLEALEEETRRLSVEENMRDRVTAVVHDTILNDLAIVINAPDQLDARARTRLRDDLSTLRSAEWLRQSADINVSVDDQDIAIRNQISQLISDLQWRGLTVHVTGSGSGIYRLSPEAAVAVVEAISACLENVLKHSAVTVAEVDLGYQDNQITVTVSDSGVGFDVDAIPADRLGVRVSIVGRIAAIGGQARIWSAPNEGTSVVMRIPVEQKISDHEGVAHGTT